MEIEKLKKPLPRWKEHCKQKKASGRVEMCGGKMKGGAQDSYSNFTSDERTQRLGMMVWICNGSFILRLLNA